MNVWLSVKMLHVLCGTFWVGATVLLAFYVLPTVRALGPAGGAVMQQLAAIRRLPTMMNVVGGLATLSGLALFAVRHPNLHSVHGIALTFGALCGLVAAVWGGFVQSRTAKKLGALAAQAAGSPTSEQAATMRQLQERLHSGARLGAGLLILAVLGMAMAHPL